MSTLADRLEAMLHQVGHPDYSLGEFYDGVKNALQPQLLTVEKPEMPKP